MRTYRCEFCGNEYTRDEVLPPRGTIRPPGMGWRCRDCHSGELVRQLKDIVMPSRPAPIRTKRYSQ